MYKLKPSIPYLILAIALALRLFQLDAAQFWYDESFTVILARQPIPNLLLATAGDNHPPLYYLLSWFANLSSGPAQFLFRFQSVLYSVLSILVVWRIGNVLKLKDSVTWAAMAFMALSPFQVFFGQEARMYALLQLLILAWILNVLTRSWIAAAIFATLALYTHNYAIFYAPVIAIVAMARELPRPVNVDYHRNPFPALIKWLPGDESQWRRALLSFIVPLIFYIPWAVVLLGQMSNVANGFWIEALTPGSVIDAIAKLCLGFYLPQNVAASGVLIVCGVLIYAIIAARQSAPKELYLLGFAPIILAAVVSVVWQPIFLFRGLIACSPALYLLVAHAFSSSRRTAWIGVALILPILLISLVSYYPGNIAKKGDQSQLIELIQSNWRDGDIVFHGSDSTALRWMAYAPQVPMAVRPICTGDLTIGALSQATRAALNFPVHALADLHYTRAWVLWSAGPTASMCEHREVTQLLNSARLVLSKNELFASGGVWLIEDPN